METFSSEPLMTEKHGPILGRVIKNKNNLYDICGLHRRLLYSGCDQSVGTYLHVITSQNTMIL
jgi:hypothetical protein